MALRVDAAEKRRHIIETAYRLFKRDGFHSTGIDTIIAEAEVAKMTMYRHFPSKDELIVEVLAWRMERFERQLIQLGQLTDATMAPADKIGAIFDWHERWFKSPDFHGCLFQHALAEYGTPSHPVFEAAVRQKRDLQRRLRDILTQLVPDDHVDNVSITFLMLIEGATVLAHMGQGKAAISSAKKTAADVLALTGTRQ